jgi:hypothetical protein
MTTELGYGGAGYGFSGWNLENIGKRKKPWKPIEMSYEDRENLKSFARQLKNSGNINALADIIDMIAHWQRNPGVSFADYAPQWVAAQTTRTDHATADKALCDFYPLVNVPQLIPTGYTDCGFAEAAIEREKIAAKDRAKKWSK